MDVYSELSDVELSILYKSGDHGAFTQIYQRYWSVLYIHAMKILQDSEHARDMVQEVFTHLWNIRQAIELHTSLKSYLYTCIRNQCLSMLREGKVHDKFMDFLAVHYAEGANVTEDELSFKLFSEAMSREIDKLPPRMKQVFLKSRNEGLSYKAIASELDIAENTVRKTIRRTLTVLRGKLGMWPVIFIYLWRR